MDPICKITVVTDVDGNEALYLNEALYHSSDTIFASIINEAQKKAGADAIDFDHLNIGHSFGQWPDAIAEAMSGGGRD